MQDNTQWLASLAKEKKWRQSSAHRMTGCRLNDAAITDRLHGTASRFWPHSRPDAVTIPITTTTDCTTSVPWSYSISSLRPKKINPAQPWKLLCWATKECDVRWKQQDLSQQNYQTQYLSAQFGGGFVCFWGWVEVKLHPELPQHLQQETNQLCRLLTAWSFGYNQQKVLIKKKNVDTVLESSLPDSIMRKHRGIISVVSKKFITSCSSVFTKAPWRKNKNQSHLLIH